MVEYRVGGALIVFREGWTEITLNSGGFVSIPWTEKDGDEALARELGYEIAVEMNRDHDPLHVLVAHWLGLPDSGPLLYAAGHRPADPLWREEEAILFAIHRYMRAAGLRVDDLLRAHQVRSCAPAP